MKRIFIAISFWGGLLAGCGDTKNKVASSAAEKAIEAISGQKIDMADAEDIGKNKPEVNIVLDGEDIGKRFKDGFGSVTASKETVAITVAGGENGQDNILIGFTGKDLTTLRPIAGKMVKGENDGFTFSITRITDNSMEVQLSFEAEGEIVSWQKEKIVIKVKGKTGNSSDAENPDKWKAYEGTITLNYPVFQVLGGKKEAFLY